MIALPVSPNEKNLILHITRTLKIQTKDLVCESLPLRFLALGVELYVRGVCLVNKAEVSRYLEHTQPVSKVSLPQADKNCTKSVKEDVNIWKRTKSNVVVFVELRSCRKNPGTLEYEMYSARGFCFN
jgi:hypothetical protein